MADGPRDYRDPKVTADGGTKKWLWYVVGAVVLLLLLAWLMGWFATTPEDDMTVEEPVIEQGTTTPTDPALTTPTDPVVVDPAPPVVDPATPPAVVE